jgi:glycosyltransferase involved in cell wall biosynthesis
LTAADLDERDRHLRAEAVANVDLFLSPSKFLHDELVTWGIPKKQIATSMIGIDRRSLRGLHRTRSPRVRVAFHGSLMRTKGAHVVLEAWARLPKNVAALGTLTIRGAPRDAAYLKEVSALAKRAGAILDREFPRSELAAKLSETDLLVVPSIWWENSPLAILEGLAARIPLLVSNLGGMAELVEEGRGGYRFRPGDPDDLARGLRQCLESPAHLARCVSREIAVRTIDDDARELPVKILQHHTR